MPKHALVGVVLGVGVLVLADAAVSTSQDVWKKLRRPLHIPRIAPGNPCPASRPDPKGDLSRLGFVGTAWGRGPAYPGLGGAEDRPIVPFFQPSPPQSLSFGSEWGGQKVMWIVARTYKGRILIRGRQLDGRNRLRFGQGEPPALELKLRHGPGGYPSTTRLRAGGCYAYQIDGGTFSRLVVFEARAISPYPDRDRLVDALRVVGLPMEFEDTSTGFFGVPHYSYSNPVGFVEIFEFTNEDSARSASAQVAPSGDVGAGHVDWIAPPHWFRVGRFLALYLGSDRNALTILARVCGRQFAGAPSP